MNFFSFLIIPLFFAVLAQAFSAHADSKLETVNVSGNITEELSPYDFIGSHTSIDLDKYSEQFYNLNDILKQQSGIDLKSTSGVGQYSVPLIRGSETQQVLIFTDGAPLNSLNGGTSNIGSVNISGAQSIHIYRGFVPMELSPTAIGGAINVISQPNEDNQGSVKHSVGTYGVSSTQLEQSLNLSKALINFSVLDQHAENDFIYEEQQPVNSPSSPKNEPRYNNATKNSIVKTHLHYNINRDNAFTSQFAHQNYNRELSSLINTNLNNANLNTVKNDITSAYQHGNTSDGRSKIKYHYIDTKEIYDDRESQIGLGIQYNQYSSEYHHLNYSYSYATDSTLTTLNQQIRYENFGIRYLNDNKSNTETCFENRQCDRSYTRQQNSSGVRIDSKINKHIQTSHQIVLINNKDDIPNTNNTRSDDDWSLFSGLTLNLQELGKLSFSASKQIRIPTTTELFGDRGSSIGNPNLKPESSIGFEMTYEHSTHTSLSSVSIYSRDVSDNIVTVYDSRGIISYKNIGKSRLNGIELSLSTDLNQFFSYNTNLSYQNSEILKNEDNSFIGSELSNHRTWFNNHGILFAFHNYRLGIDSSFQSGGYYDNQNTLSRPDKLEINAHATYNWQLSSLSINAFNISNNQTRNYPQTPAVGTTIYITYQQKWNL